MTAPMEIDHIHNRIEKFDPGTRIEPSSRKSSGKNFSEVLKSSLGTDSATGEPVKDEPIEYIVKPGDTLWKIGKHLFKKNPYQIARDNGLSNPNLILPGQKLLIYPSRSKAIELKINGEVTASWYGAEHHNKITASGERFDMYKNTLAHKTLPLGTKVRLVNPENGKIAEGLVNDRGPYIKGREVDVSYALAKQLGFVKKGITKLNVEVI
ncbi:MAG: septal ring lytic transglycosylase RlpA family protein [Deltaproteobacteria bacterium]|nr:septal ring lytic transglycosylase RlpA family protein [Deltaproteobacteria bacterium]